MNRKRKAEADIKIIRSIQIHLNVVTAALLLTGQITIKGVFIGASGFSMALGGPLTGETRLVGEEGNQLATALIDIIDIILATLLLKKDLFITGIFISPARFTIDVSGPITGAEIPSPTIPELERDYRFFQRIVNKHFKVDDHLVNSLREEGMRWL
ncbi:hypothetical protein [Halalkalibacter nanhaiisediminis]|uniref:Uncharacterized protein n=1 Tax=Halalkalibacter nanhaiisediminis TaxID=688079 RepID=A0A562QBC0_9BACI|nr:hypothetical protein [Halalkalibacter nanhaiisediminis]TWI53316.1 hypothetical protein IQ10_03451 [Halalkalibacter nanhaiisediminis]